MKLHNFVWAQHASPADFWRVQNVHFMKMGSIFFHVVGTVLWKLEQKYQQAFDYHL